jgi:hypothetical protein
VWGKSSVYVVPPCRCGEKRAAKPKPKGLLAGVIKMNVQAGILPACSRRRRPHSFAERYPFGYLGRISVATSPLIVCSLSADDVGKGNGWDRVKEYL